MEEGRGEGRRRRRVGGEGRPYDRRRNEEARGRERKCGSGAWVRYVKAEEDSLIS